MPYIEPNSTIRLFKNIPFDPDYKDTMYFSTENARDGWFSDRVFKTYNNVSYQRQSINTIRLEETMGVAYNYNYMAFKNDSFENKWFYAFVLNVEYINNITVEIRYEIDYIQTWLLNTDFNECFIERQHSETDNYGDNLIPESPNTGPFVYEELTPINYTPCVIVVSTLDLQHVVDIPVTAVPGYQNLGRCGMISGCWYYRFTTDANGLAGLEVTLKAIEALQRQSEVICIIMAAAELWPDSENMGSYNPDYHYYTPPSSLGAYTPRNKKLLCYPYYSLAVNTWDGNETLLQQELFENLDTRGYALLEGWENINAISSLVLIPHGYKNRAINEAEAIESPTTPQCSWKSDQYMAWLAQNFMGIVSNTIKNARPQFKMNETPTGSELMDPTAGLNSNGLAPTNGAPNVGAHLTGVNVPIGRALTLIDAFVAKPISIPDKFNGELSNTTRYQLRGLGFDVSRRHITEEFARKIDQYFDMFGYRMNKVAVPNIHARPKYTFIKTIGCSVHGYAPAYAARRIENIFDKGIRFWDTSATFGSFDKDINNNSPI